MLTAGEANAQLIVLLVCGGIFVLNFFRRLYIEISCIDSVFSIRESPRGHLVCLRNAASFSDEIESVEIKHLNEFMSIFSVKDIPKIPLRITHAIEIDSRVQSRWSPISGTVDLSLDLAGVSTVDLHIFSHVPVWVLRELFSRETQPSDSQRYKYSWREIFTEIIFGTRKTIDRDIYISAEETYSSIHRNTSASVVERMQRLFNRFEITSLQDSLQIDTHQDETDPSIPLIILSRRSYNERGSDDFARLDLILGEETITVFFDPNANSFLPFACIPSFYGIDERTCTICCDANIDTLLIDCAHCALCEGCANSLRDNRCPICRKAFTEKIIIPINVS